MQKGKILAIDYGKKRIGLASGDLSLRIASPYGVIAGKNESYAISKILEFCRKWDVKLIIVGLPLDMRDDSDENEMSKSVYGFVKNIREALVSFDNGALKNIKVDLHDERLSSFEADKLMNDAGETHYKSGNYRDCYAAQVILQRFFDSNKN